MNQIKLLEGINDIPFGISKDDFIKQMGEPDQIETISEDDDPVTTILLQYANMETSFFFEGKDNKYHLNSCDSSNTSIELFGKAIFSYSPKQLKELFNEMGFPKSETQTEEWGEMRLSFENAMVDFYFKDAKLSSVIWGY